jgi:hypothetical protein
MAALNPLVAASAANPLALPEQLENSDLLIQLADDSSPIAQLFRARETCTIGRAYNNQLVLTDEFVSAHPVRLFRQLETATPYNDTASALPQTGTSATQTTQTTGQWGWHLQILDPNTQVLINHTPLKSRQNPYPLQSGDRLTLGKTTLELLSPAHPVAAAKPLNFSRWQHGIMSILAPLLLLPLVLLLHALINRVIADPSAPWHDDLLGIVGGVMLTAMWAGGWALIGKIFRQQSNFFRHLLIPAILLAVMLPLDRIGPWLEFNSNDYYSEDLTNYAIMLVMIALLLHYHLQLATAIRHTRITACITAVIAVGGSMAMDWQNQKMIKRWPHYAQTLAPAALYTGSVQSADEFFASLQTDLDNMPPANEDFTDSDSGIDDDMMDINEAD